MFTALVILTLIVGIAIFAIVEKVKTNALRTALVGSQRVEAVKASQVNRTVKEYAKSGWAIESQSSAKSFGSQALVTITFRKDRQVA